MLGRLRVLDRGTPWLGQRELGTRARECSAKELDCEHALRQRIPVLRRSRNAQEKP